MQTINLSIVFGMEHMGMVLKGDAKENEWLDDRSKHKRRDEKDVV
jgi:hypothetical protein